MTSPVDELLARSAPPVAAIAAAGRARLRALLPDIKEEADPAANVIGFGYGPGYRHLICTLILSRNGVKLGFYRGARLPDPAGMLKGGGKVHRYAELGSPEATEDPRLAQLILAAAQAYRDAELLDRGGR
jgi:hypothetical protein